MENSTMEFSLDGEIESLCKLFTFDHQPNFCDEFFSHSIYNNEYFFHNNPSNFLPPNQNCFSFHNNDSISNGDLSDNASDSTSYNKVSQNTNNDCYQNYSHFLSQSDAFFPINISSLTEQEDNSSVNVGSPLSNEVPLKRKHNNNNNTLERVEGAKKRARVSKDRGSNCIEAKNCDDNNRNDSSKEENSEDRELSKACEQVSEGESSALTEISKGTKKRASRGEATDPQSLYARRRREKINQRLKILQSLVPNGTKVDISTMLEEALHYVKFLQRQIKLLSSDELWMYAPIAYNGVDMSLYKGITPFLLP